MRRRRIPDDYRSRRLAWPRLAAAGLLAWCCALAGCASCRPSNDRDWTPDQAVLSSAEFDGNLVHVHNIRNCDYRTETDYDVRHYDKTFDLDKLDEVDFVVSPFPDSKVLAHTFLSFGFEGGDYVAVSVEIRKERGESYSPLGGLQNKYEIMYVVADERDLIGLRANHRLADVYLYRAKATPRQARALFVDIMRRTNKLSEQPEFYNTVANNCTTNIMRHVNRIAPARIPYGYQVLLPGLTDKLAYDLDLLDSKKPFAETRLEARVNRLAFEHRDDPEFSRKIRR